MQTEFLPRSDLRSIKAASHGGVSLKKRRKLARPLIPGCITHVVFKSSKAKGSLSFYTHKLLVHKLLKAKSKKFFVELLDYVNMGNHLHLKVRFKDKKRFAQFLKSFSSLLARSITHAKRGNPFGRFWDGLVYTRVLLTRLEELGLKGYFEGNHRQRELGYRARDEYLKRFNQMIYRLRKTKARAGPLSRIQEELTLV